MNYGICDLAIIPLRAEPSDKSEMVSQLLFGETVEILVKEKQWLRVRCHHDDYEGWMDEKQIRFLSTEHAKKNDESSTAIVLNPFAEARSQNCTHLLLLGSSLPNYSEGHFMIGSEEFKIQTDVTLPGKQPSFQRIPWYALKFAGSPYLWGGRSLFGVDCSGFTQLVFKLAGIRLSRDAWQQSEQGILIPFIDQAQPGDLAFFHNEDSKITHAGIILESQKIIHASGRVRIDTIDHYGIFNEETKQYSHKLRFIKRLIH